MDITGERGVEAVCFADTRGSQVEIVQNIGRALRLNRDGSTKVARIIVPVFLEPGEDPTDMVASTSFKPLVAVLQGLRSHDERLVEQLASRALTSGKRKVHIQRDEDRRIVEAGGKGEGEGQERDDTDGAVESALLHFSTPRDPATIAAFLRTRVYRPESLVWLEGYQALLRWRKKHEITGLYAVPYDVEAEVGATKAFPLGRWVHQQRKALRAGELEERRKELLDAPEAGMVWEPGEEAWENKLAALRSYRRATGHLAPPARTRSGARARPWCPSGSTRPISAARAASGKTPSAPQRGGHSWRRSTRTGTARGHSTGNATTASSRTWSTPTASCRPSSRVSCSRATTWASGSHGNARRAPGRNCPPSSRSASPGWACSRLRRRLPPRRPRGRRRGPSKAQQAFQRGVQALAQWVEREGQRPVPRGAIEEIAVDGETEPVTVKLGVWVSNTRARRDKLSAEQLAALAALGVDWAGPAPTDEGSEQLAPTEAPVPEQRDAGGAGADDESEAEVACGLARMKRLTELTRKHTKAELLRMAYAGGLVRHNSPEQWRKDEIASAVVDQELRAAARAGADQPPAPPTAVVPAKRPPVRHHHDEWDMTMYEGGACTCDLIEQYGTPSERDDY